MRFELMAFLMDPFVLMFAAVISGILFGKIKFGKTFTFGISGTLFTGLLFGWLATRLGTSIVGQGETAAGFKAATSMLGSGVISKGFFDFFLVLFVTAVGLLAAKDLKAVIKKYGMKFVILGVVTTFAGGSMTYAMTLINNSVGGSATPYEVSGVYTGALTSSPGLAAALETAGKESEKVAERYQASDEVGKQKILNAISPETTLNPADYPELSKDDVESYRTHAEAGVGIGHAVAYPFGVLIVILGVNFLPKIFRINIDEEWKRYDAEMLAAKESTGEKEIPEVPFSIMTFFLTALIGYLFGGIEVYLGPLGYFSLGATGGALIMALFLGYLGKIGPVNFRMEGKILVALRQIGLGFFLAIVGLRYGAAVAGALNASGLVLVGVAIVVSLFAMLVGFLLGRYVFKLNWILLSGAICGGMTSTPGMGAAVDALNSDKPAAGYGATYPFALLTKVILVIILHKLPM